MLLVQELTWSGWKTQAENSVAQELQKLLEVCSADVPICKFSHQQETSSLNLPRLKMSRAWKREWKGKESKKTGNKSAKKMGVKRNEIEKKIRVKRYENEKKKKSVNWNESAKKEKVYRKGKWKKWKWKVKEI